jgi:hypothetical protein
MEQLRRLATGVELGRSQSSPCLMTSDVKLVTMGRVPRLWLRTHLSQF